VVQPRYNFRRCLSKDFGDVLYRLPCGQHVDWRHVDQPPLLAGIAWFTRYGFREPRSRS
jgi:hypothetical protein